MARRVQTEWTGLGGAPYLTTLYFADGTPGTDQALVTAVAAVWDAFGSFIPTTLTYSVLGEVVTYSAPDTPTGTVAVTGVSATGDSTSSLGPLSTQGLVRLRTGAFRGAREVQGRIFIPGVTLGAINGSNGRATSGYVAALNALGTDLVELGLQVASRAANQFYPVTAATGWTDLAVLRSRRD